ncbi:MAG: sigma-70 family RNA polymerase sigma factor [Lachnospiraceae bacterium]|jgi:RNA polymerase sigma factor (sigma-70 family)|nr:sigma-70 family RNA polymerase sigma factor [Lachnospiraceae bacterium]
MNTTEDKFHRIYENYKNLIYKIAYDETKDYYLAQDICQKTFEKLYDYREHVDEKRAKSWLIVIASNEARDHFRKGGKYSVLLSGTAEMECIIERENCIDLHVEQEARKQLLDHMLDGLCRKNRDWYEVFMLAEYLEIPRKVIAKQREISLSTVDAYLRKAKSWLSKHYQKDYDKL